MTLAYAARPPSACCITAVIYYIISSMLYKFVMDDGLEIGILTGLLSITSIMLVLTQRFYLENDHKNIQFVIL